MDAMLALDQTRADVWMLLNSGGALRQRRLVMRGPYGDGDL
jgi:hypothetical protein